MTLSSTVKSFLEKISIGFDSFSRAHAAAELARAGYHKQANELINETNTFKLQ